MTYGDKDLQKFMSKYINNLFTVGVFNWPDQLKIQLLRENFNKALKNKMVGQTAPDCT